MADPQVGGEEAVADPQVSGEEGVADPRVGVGLGCGCSGSPGRRGECCSTSSGGR